MAQKRAYLRNDFMAITNNIYCAILLDCLVRATDAGQKDVMLTFNDLAEMSMIKRSDVSVGRYIGKLVDKGYITYKIKHGIRSYELCVKNIKNALTAAGYDDSIETPI